MDWHEVLQILIDDVSDQRHQMCQIECRVHWRAIVAVATVYLGCCHLLQLLCRTSPFPAVDCWAHHVASLSPGSLQFGRGHLAANAKDSELLVHVTEESEGED